ADLIEGEKVEVFNLNNGQRLETYVIKAKANSGIIGLNGPAARNGYIGDEVIILSYIQVDEKEAKKIKPKIVKVDAKNRIK
ncbi:MAG: aspartate 1-decarboxylase, partial [Candidatus Omnitrophica bacterium]|nr:aspartate 1-decarboxylase [Candidatus Omnitrophota bacterium]